jgi:hypothetical protein
MSWNYRVVRNGHGLRIFDVYYDGAGRPISTHSVPTYVAGESVDDLADQLALMRDALAKPILDESEIGGDVAQPAHQR